MLLILSGLSANQGTFLVLSRALSRLYRDEVHVTSTKKSTAKSNKCNANVTLDQVDAFSLQVILQIKFDLPSLLHSRY